MTFLKYRQLATKENRTELKREYKSLLSKARIRGCVPTVRYAALKEARGFAAEHSLEFPFELQRELGRVARIVLAGFLQYEYEGRATK